MIELQVGDIGLCEAGTGYHLDISTMHRDILGGPETLREDTVFMVLEKEAIGSAGKGWAYKCAFTPIGIGWVNAINVVPCFQGLDEQG
jgi:hypothetical protein